MSIRYFATNRAIGDLGQAVEESHGSRGQRVNLQRGGHYFVDMNRYMAYYLGELDSDRMPAKAVVKNSEEDVFKLFLSSEKIGRIVVCVHGFNVALFEAYTWFRVLVETMQHQERLAKCIVTDHEGLDPDAETGSLTAFVGFSWPSNGSVFSYRSDQHEALGAANAFGNLLGRLHTTGKPVSLICHSMGNYMACNTLKAIVNGEVTLPALASDASLKELMMRVDARMDLGSKAKLNLEKRLIDCYVMIAPDVERRHIIKARGDGVETSYVGPFHSGLEHLVGRTVNVYSRFDSALKVSDWEKKPREALHAVGDTVSRWSLGLLDFLERNPDEKWEKRLGAAPHPEAAPDSVASVNATELAGRKIDHSDHIDCTALALRIAKELGI